MLDSIIDLFPRDYTNDEIVVYTQAPSYTRIAKNLTRSQTKRKPKPLTSTITRSTTTFVSYNLSTTSSDWEITDSSSNYSSWSEKSIGSITSENNEEKYIDSKGRWIPIIAHSEKPATTSSIVKDWLSRIHSTIFGKPTPVRQISTQSVPNYKNNIQDQILFEKYKMQRKTKSVPEFHIKSTSFDITDIQKSLCEKCYPSPLYHFISTSPIKSSTHASTIKPPLENNKESPLKLEQFIIYQKELSTMYPPNNPTFVVSCRGV